MNRAVMDVSPRVPSKQRTVGVVEMLVCMLSGCGCTQVLVLDFVDVFRMTRPEDTIVIFVLRGSDV